MLKEVRNGVTFWVKRFLSNIRNKSSILPQHEGLQTAMNCPVEIIVFRASDKEARSPLCMKAIKTKMLTLQNQDKKTQVWLTEPQKETI